MAPNPAFPIFPAPGDDSSDSSAGQDTADLSPAAVIAANAAALHSTLSALVPLPFPKAIIPSAVIPGGVMLQWVTNDGSEHELVAHLGSRPVARMSFDLGGPFDVAVDSDGPGDLAFPAALMGDLRRFKTFEPVGVEDEDRLYDDVEWVAQGKAGGTAKPCDSPACDPPCDAREADAIGTCCRKAGQAHQEHGDWPMAAPASDPAYKITADTPWRDTPSFLADVAPKSAPRTLATRDQLFAATLPRAREEVKAAVSPLVWILLKPIIEKLLAAFFKSLFEVKSEFAARGMGIAIEDE